MTYHHLLGCRLKVLHWKEVQPPFWKYVRRKLKKLAGVQSFVYSWRPGAQLTVKNERSRALAHCHMFAVALTHVGADSVFA